MYRKNLENISKHQQIACTNFKKNLENNINTLSENSQQTFIRDTTKILDLFKNPITNCIKNVQKENVSRKKEEDNIITIKKNISTNTDMNKMYVHLYEYVII